MIQVVEFLEEIIHSKENLVDYARREGARPHRRPVLLPAGHGLEVFLVNGARRRRSISGPDN